MTAMGKTVLKINHAGVRVLACFYYLGDGYNLSSLKWTNTKIELRSGILDLRKTTVNSVELYLIGASLEVRGAEISGYNYKPSPNLLNESRAQPGEPSTV